LALITKYNSEIAWGAPVRSLNFELPPAKKLDRLATLHQHFRRVDAGRSWLDIRNDVPLQLAAERDSIVRAGGSRGSQARAN
jgi:hypothetical protein